MAKSPITGPLSKEKSPITQMAKSIIALPLQKRKHHQHLKKGERESYTAVEPRSAILA